MNHYLAINAYRNSTGDGFANTWNVMRVKSRREQLRILAHGLPVHDIWFADGTPCYSTFGIRLATRAEIEREAKYYGGKTRIPFFDD